MLYAISQYEKLKDFIFDLSIQYNMEVVDVVNLLQMIRNYGDGNPIMVPPRTGSRWTFTVPEPSDLIDLREAWRKSRIDEITCQCILAQNPTMSDLIDVQLNCYRWLRFWSIRDPDPEWREKLRQMVASTIETFAYGRAEAAKHNNPKAQLVLERLVP